MPRSSEGAVWPEKVVGGKYVRMLEKFLRQLQAEEPHGNRKLFLDDVFVAHLLAFFNPSVRSLRTLEDFSQSQQAQRHLSIRRLCKSTLSDFHRIADPERLQPMMKALRKKVDSGTSKDGELAQVLSKAVAVDGTFLPALAEVTWAVRCANQRNDDQRFRARVDCHVQVDTWVPEAIVVPEPKQSESMSAIDHIEPGKIYLFDRAYSSFALINAHYDPADASLMPQSHFVIRYRPAGGNAPTLQEGAERKLLKADIAAGVVSDRVGKFHSTRPKRHGILDVALREVVVQYDEDGETKTIRLITNLIEVSAATIARLYEHRWHVELFFRWLKSFGNFNHLICQNRDGAQLHFYVTVIAVLLMYLHTGFRPSKYTFALMSQVASGGATLEEIMPILRERERRCALARESQKKRKAKQTNEK